MNCIVLQPCIVLLDHSSDCSREGVIGKNTLPMPTQQGFQAPPVHWRVSLHLKIRSLSFLLPMICLAHAHPLYPTQQFCTQLCSLHIPQQVQQDKNPGEKQLGPEVSLRTLVYKHSQLFLHTCLPEFASATGQGSKRPNTEAWPCQHLNKRLLSPAPRLSHEATDTQPVVSCYHFSGMGSEETGSQEAS